MPKQNRLDHLILESNIKILLQKNKINQDRFASDLNMAQSTFNKRLKGHVSFTIDEVFAIAQYFGVSIDELCRNDFANTVGEPKKPINDEPDTPPRVNVLHSTCTALAEIFKYTYVKIQPVQFPEDVYAEELEDGYRATGMFYPVHNKDGSNPIHEYASVCFPNYFPTESEFDSQDDADDYYTELRYNGNLINSNPLINDFLKKLIDLYNTYQNNSIETEDYHRSIDNVLARFLAINK